MNILFHNIIKFLILFLLFGHSNLAVCQNSNPENFSIDTNTISYFYEPYPQKVGSSIFQIGGLFTFVPTPLVEDEYPIPSFDLDYKRGIHEFASFDARFTTNVFSNILHFGILGNMNTGRFSYGISNHIGAFYGFLTYEGQFDRNWAYSIFYMPTLRFGYRFDDFSISTSFSAIYLLKTASKVSNMNEISIDNTWNDYFVTFAIEQPFLKEQKISLGMSILFTRTPYQVWMLYNTIDEYMIEPEFFFAFQI